MPPIPDDLTRLRAFVAGFDPSGQPRADFIRRARAGLDGSGQRLLVLDASFNPMTLAHEWMAVQARDTVGAGEVVLMLSRANVDKEVHGADLGERLATLLAYSEERPDTSVVGCSHARFVDKAEALAALYPEHTLFHFVLGYDTLERLFAPKYYGDMQEELSRFFARSRVVAANRGPHSPADLQAFLRRPVCRPYVDRIAVIHLPEALATISSTQVRERIRLGLPIEDLVPRSVARAITVLGLYAQ
jgi:nicotinic acid mononucleotide adenylyltransferase